MFELRQAVRGLVRAPALTTVAILTLGLAIGANAGIFSVIETVLLDPLPFVDNERLVYVAASAPGSDMPDEFRASPELLVQYQEESKTLESIAAYNSFTSTLRDGDRVERVRMSSPTFSLFSTLGIGPALGRLPTAEDEEKTVVLSHTLWTTWFNQDPGILGRSLYVSGEDREVIGVMPEGFWFPNDGTLLWFPFKIDLDELGPGRFVMPLVGRMSPEADEEAVATELTALSRLVPKRFGGSTRLQGLMEQHQAVVRPLEEQLLGDFSGPLWILLSAMGILLLIACANVANLLMVRGERRLPEHAVRSALGAGKGRLVLGRMLEAGLIALPSGVLAVVLAWASVPLLVSAAPSGIPRLGEVGIRPGSLLFTFGVSVLAALLCGLWPALRFAAPSLTAIREGGRGMGRRRGVGRSALVAGQTALAMVLLIGSSLLAQSFVKLRDVDPGYSTEDVFTFQIAPEGAHLSDAPSYAAFHLDFMERLRALPGVETVGIVENVPLDEGLATRRFRTEDTAAEEDAGPTLSMTFSAGDYFQAMDIEVQQGRTFTTEDHTTNLGHVLVSRAAAELLWPGQEAVGRRLKMEGAEMWETVVGVVDDIRQFGFREESEPMVYYPLVGQDPENRREVSSPGYVIKTRRAEVIGPEIRALVKEVAPMAPMYRVYTMAFLAERSMVQLRFTALTLGVTAFLAFFLGLIGLYGTLSHDVEERTREIGLRMALGARAYQVHFLVVRQGAWVLAIGVAIGLTAAVPASRLLADLLFELSSVDGKTFFSVASATFLVGLAASYLPAVRASRVEPMECLRGE